MNTTQWVRTHAPYDVDEGLIGNNISDYQSYLNTERAIKCVSWEEKKTPLIAILKFNAAQHTEYVRCQKRSQKWS